ncbi:aromatic ring-opening dioxygenase LigA [Cellulomonas endophytica]|uniref:aromatic ring-opening dioxygenase LigA n=1 Tax=Cellulomonas endophytica TaxID=2494735 RepID=UPI00101290FD|nr:aromatic ring-opening dioxygenase LigA [Cellulomonas endophytica]
MNATPTARRPLVRVVAVLAMVAGLVLVVGGAVTWGMVSTKLAAENITVSEDAGMFAGQAVTTPWTAFAEADIISHHALEATGGLTYAELDREDPLREVAMNGSFLRASLFTSVVAFGVAALVMGLGVLFGLVGAALLVLDRRDGRVTPAAAPAAGAVPALA